MYMRVNAVVSELLYTETKQGGRMAAAHAQWRATHLEMPLPLLCIRPMAAMYV